MKGFLAWRIAQSVEAARHKYAAQTGEMDPRIVVDINPEGMQQLRRDLLDIAAERCAPAHTREGVWIAGAQVHDNCDIGYDIPIYRVLVVVADEKSCGIEAPFSFGGTA